MSQIPPARRSVGWAGCFALLLCPFVFGGMWYVMVGSQPHVPTTQELLDENQKEQVQADLKKMRAEEALRIGIEYEKLRYLPHPTFQQQSRMRELIERMEELDPSVIIRTPPKQQEK